MSHTNVSTTDDVKESTVEQSVTSCMSTCDPPTYNGVPVFCTSNIACVGAPEGAYCEQDNFSVFIAGKNSLASESLSMILGPGGNSPNNQLRWDSGSQALFVTQNAQTIITSPTGDPRVYHALSATCDGSTITFYRDGVAKSSSSFTTSSPWTIASIGSWYSSFFMAGDLAEVIVYDRALSDSERATVNAYLRGKYGLP